MTGMVRSEDARLATAAWILVGVTRNVPGVLLHDGRRLAFIGAEGVLLDVPLDGVRDVTFPWYWFGGGCTIRAGEEQVRLSFVRPNGAEDLTESDVAAFRRFAARQLGPAGDLVSAAHSLRDIGAGREAARRWRRLLRPSSA